MSAVKGLYIVNVNTQDSKHNLSVNTTFVPSIEYQQSLLTSPDLSKWQPLLRITGHYALYQYNNTKKCTVITVITWHTCVTGGHYALGGQISGMINILIARILIGQHFLAN